MIHRCRSHGDSVSRRKAAVMHFPFMDTIAGYVTSYHRDGGRFELETASGERFGVALVGDVSAELLRNLDEPYADASDHVQELLSPGRHLFVYGVFYPEHGGDTFEAKRLVFLGPGGGGYTFQKSGSGAQQIDSFAPVFPPGPP